MNTELRKKAKSDFEKDFLKLINSSVSGKKTMANVRKHRDVKFITTGKSRNYLIPKPNYHTTSFFSESLLATKIKKKRIAMNKLVYLGFSILEISKIARYEFWYDYVKPKYNEKAKLCYMDPDSVTVHVIK